MKNEISESLSRRIMNMGVLSIFLIICGHYAWGVSSEVEDVCYECIKAIWRFATPAFFVTSGYFLARRADDDDWWKRECVKRVHSLIVPFFIWGLIGVIGTNGYMLVKDYCLDRELFYNVRLSGLQILADIGLHPYRLPLVGPLWYLRALFVLVLISPVIKKMCGFWWLLWTFLIYGLVCPRGECLSPVQLFFRITFSLEGLFYFSLGYYLYSRRIAISFKSQCWVLMVGLLGMLVFVVLKKQCSATWVYLVRWVSIPLVLQGIWRIMPAWRLPRIIVKGTFPAYLIHFIVLMAFSRIGLIRICCVNFVTSITFGFFVWLLSAVVIPCFIRRFLPSFSVLAFGGRG